MEFKDKYFLVVGYAVTGRSVAQYLLRQGAHVTITDQSDLSTDTSVELLLQQGAQLVDGGHPLTLLEQPVDYIVKNPGIPYQIPLIQKAQTMGIPIVTDVEIASQITAGHIIGITGSNGKTTTTSMIYELLKHREVQATFVAGNIGIPTLEVAEKAGENDDIVMELSSFQLKGTQLFQPDIAVICNIFEAHLDYHQTREDYVASKLNLIKHLTAENYLVYNYDLSELRQQVAKSPAQLIPFAVDVVDDFVKARGAYLENGQLYFKGQLIMAADEMFLPGLHNIANALAAIAVACIRQVDTQLIRQTLMTYKGMPHRLQPVVESQGRIFYNDSKSTNQVATITALKSFQQPIVYIGGGLDRGNEFDELIPHLSFVKSACLYGESKYKMEQAFLKAGVDHINIYEDLAAATQAAYQVAEVGDVVLFSPSNASWDQFKNFEVRGAHFVALVQQLIANQPYHKEEEVSHEIN